MANRVSNEQLITLLEFLTEHPSLAKGVGLGTRSRETVDKLWNEVAIKLNSFDSGSSKSGDRWKKYWADIKHKAKIKLKKRRKDARATGKDPSSLEDLSELEKKILAVVDKAVFGKNELDSPILNIVELETSTHTACLTDSEEVDSSDNETDVPLLREHKPVLDYPSNKKLGNASYTPETHFEEPHTGMKRRVSRSSRDRVILKRRRFPYSDPSSPNIEWIMKIEQGRLEAERTLANAARIVAEATRAQVEIARDQANTTRMLVEVVQNLVKNVSSLVQRHNQ